MTYHMTPTGPKPCKAVNGKCPYQDREHGDKATLETEYKQDTERISELESRLLKAATDYYQGNGDSGMTDEEYDAGVNYLRTMSKKYDMSGTARLLMDGAVAAGTTVNAKGTITVHHDTPMLSLAKANNREEVESYIRKTLQAGATGFKLQAKFDGIACSAVYEHGKLVQMSTRGDGSNGEDMSGLINNANIIIKGLPHHLNGELDNADVEIRGELFLRPSEFKTINEERVQRGENEFANPRNTNAGLVKKAANGGTEKATLQFVMYKIIGDTTEKDLIDSGVTDASTLTAAEWKATGEPIPCDSLIITAEGEDSDADEVTNRTMQVIDAFGPVRELTDLSLDGIVIKPVNETEMDKIMGFDSHHPKSQLAFKYPGATGVTTVKGIIVTVGKSGKVTPTAVLDPVEVDGTTISRATLHNYDWLSKKGVRIGSIVEIERRHDVIPAVKAVVNNPSDSKPVRPPIDCPFCGEGITDGYCKNLSCPSKKGYILKTAAGKGGLNFDGLGDRVIDALQESGLVTSIADYYDLTVNDLTNLEVDGRKFGGKRAAHVIKFIEASKELPYYKVLASLSIPDLGLQTAKVLTKKFRSIDELHSASINDLTQIEGVGAVTAEKIKSGLESRWSVIERLRSNGLQFSSKSTETVETDSGEAVQSPQERALTGVSISITGHVPEGWSNRSEWQDFVEEMGGTPLSAPKAGSDYLVWDGVRSSSKLEKARKEGVKIISPDDFTKAMSTGSLPDHSTYDENGIYVGS